MSLADTTPKKLVHSRSRAPRRRPPSPSGAWAYLWVFAVVAGAGVRFEQYATRRSLWLDEAMLSSNLVYRNLGHLVRPLAHEQGAPVGWLWLQRGAIVLLGQNEYALRLVAVVSGVGALLVLPLIARRAVGRWAAAATAVFIGASPSAIRYSAEVKQYSSDLFIASTLVLVALVVHERGGEGWSPWAWGVAASGSVWFSHPAVLVVATATAVLFGWAVWHRQSVLAISMLWAAAGSVVSFATLYVVSLRALAKDPYLRSYWASAMGPRPLSPPRLGTWLTHVIPALFSSPGNFAFPLLGIALVTTGLAILLKTGRTPLGLISLVLLVVATVTAAVDRYPLSGRLALYLLVALLLPLAALVDWSVDGLRRRRGLGLVILGLVVAVAASPVSAGLSLAVHPFATPDTRAVLQFVAAHRLPSDQVWAQWPEVPVVQYYAHTAGIDADHEVDDGGGRGSGGCGGQTPAEAAGGGRVWVVLGYRLSTAPRGERAAIVDALRGRAALLRQEARQGAVTYLFDFGADPTPGRHLVDAGLECLVVRKLTPVPSTGLHTGPLGSGRAV